ncbi:hypothetical protein [Paludibaculum fermentans]|uniref:hypothetical protein n=1 Tax=Paludibaculum fermentans TaxID=1473598 RepID=UPI003EBA9A2A
MSESIRLSPEVVTMSRGMLPVAKVVQRIQAVVRSLGRRTRAGQRPMGAPAEPGPRTLAVMGEGPDRSALQAAFDERGWGLALADNTTDALVQQMQERFQVILFQREVAGRDWRPAVRVLSRMIPRPCVVLLSDTCDMNQWEELVRCGGFDVARTPVNGNAVMRMVTAAWSIWKQQEGHAARPVVDARK